MTIERDSLDTGSPLRLQVVAEADPSALARVLERFQTLNLIPRRVLAESSTQQLHIRIDICGITEQRLALITAKIGQIPCVIDASWCRT